MTIMYRKFNEIKKMIFETRYLSYSDYIGKINFVKYTNSIYLSRQARLELKKLLENDMVRVIELRDGLFNNLSKYIANLNTLSAIDCKLSDTHFSKYAIDMIKKNNINTLGLLLNLIDTFNFSNISAIPKNVVSIINAIINFAKNKFDARNILLNLIKKEINYVPPKNNLKQNSIGEGVERNYGDVFNYHCHPQKFNKQLASYGLQKNESLKGFELEGCFEDEDNFSNCCYELANTKIKVGDNEFYLYDKNNLIMPTEDASLDEQYFCVEWWCAPMSTYFAKIYFTKFLEVLRKHGGKSGDYCNAGLHCHLDAKFFNFDIYEIFLEKLRKIAAKKKLGDVFGRDTNDWCQFPLKNKEHFVFVLTDKNKQTYKKVMVPSDFHIHKKIINIEHVKNFSNYHSVMNKLGNGEGTVEFRIGGGDKTPLDLIGVYDYLLKKVLQEAQERGI